MRFSRVLRAGLCVAAFVACGEDEVAVNFSATLSGAGEVPPVTTTATGTASIVDAAGTLTYTVTVNGLSGPAQQAHIHVGTATTPSGNVVYNFAPAALASGTLATGGLITANLSITLDSLRTLLANGNAYVNVHTVANPGGEIRGQVN